MQRGGGWSQKGGEVGFPRCSTTSVSIHIDVETSGLPAVVGPKHSASLASDAGLVEFQ